jgi:hypothetical protein
MANELAERHSLAGAVGPELVGKGWAIGTIKEGFKPETTITLPTVTLYFLPSSYVETQMGRSTSSEKSFLRRIQFDAYMESEDRAIAIRDDIADYLDGMFINIVDPLNSNTLGLLHIPDSETIRMDTLPPNLTEPKIKRWRGIVQATMQADYFTSA